MVGLGSGVSALEVNLGTHVASQAHEFATLHDHCAQLSASFSVSARQLDQDFLRSDDLYAFIHETAERVQAVEEHLALQ